MWVILVREWSSMWFQVPNEDVGWWEFLVLVVLAPPLIIWDWMRNS